MEEDGGDEGGAQDQPQGNHLEESSNEYAHLKGRGVAVQFSSVHFDLITQECRISNTEGFHAGPGPH